MLLRFLLPLVGLKLLLLLLLLLLRLLRLLQLTRQCIRRLVAKRR